MARELQVSQPVTWRVMQGKQAPPGKLIENLARDPRVNLAWLFRGEGNPTGIAGQAMPVAKVILPGPPDDHQDFLLGETYPLATGFCRPSRYWLEIQPGDPVLRSGLRLNVRDLLLMESDRRAFPTPDRLAHHLCAVRINVDGQTTLKLGLVDSVQGNDDTGPKHIEVDTFDLGVDPSEVKCDVVYRQWRGRVQRFEPLYRWKQAKEPGKRVKVPINDLDLEPILPTIAYDAVVSVCVLMVRRGLVAP